MTRARRVSALVLSLLLLSIGAAPAAASAPAVAFHAATTDTAWPYQWALEDAGHAPPNQLSPWRTEAVADADIDADAAWTAVGDDAPAVTVAVVDERIDHQQPDLQGRFSDLPPGPDVPNAAGCNDPTPDHGTAVAGIVAAVRDNGTGIAGVAPNARILPVPALDDCGTGTTDTVLAAFRYAAEQGADVVVASFATDPLLPDAQKAALQATFDAFFGAHGDMLFVVAAGNEGNDNDVNPVYPCSSRADNVLCVGRSDIDDSPSCQSNVGQNSVDLFAPGDRIYSTAWSVNGVASVGPQSGTSMSAPFVAGVAALVWNVPSRQLPAVAAASAITSGVDLRDTMRSISFTGGRLNAAGALNAAGVEGVSPDDRLGAQWGQRWQTCDRDHDGLRDVVDACPDSAGPEAMHGCPDADHDAVIDAHDDCPATYNPAQADADGDGIGDACDPQPRGPDSDGDGFAALDDRCPSQPGTVNGCPAPAPYTPPVATPPVVRPVPLAVVSVGVSAHRCKARGRCSRTAKVTVTLTRTAGTTVTVQKRVKRGHRWVWKRVLRRSLTATTSGRRLTVRRLGRGIYRVTASVTGAASKRRTFRI